VAQREPALSPAALAGLGGRDPAGRTIGFTNAYMTLDGRPWPAVAGEIHYARLEPRRWREALCLMKAGGIDVASTYVFWIHHEERQGTFDWSGRRDLRRFVELCAEAGLYAIVRVGPFCHGEARNGGLPDWLYGSPFPVRSNDPRYLSLVRRLYGEIGRQLSGLFFGKGGPVVAIQLENEFMHAGAPWETVPRSCREWVPAGTGGAEHMRILKRIALESGLEPPFFTSTAWGGAPLLEGEVLPLYGGYAFCPWNVTESAPVHAPTREYAFRDYRRPGRTDALFDPPYDPSTVPFACCEMGGGMQCWYGYRFTVPPESVEAMALVKLAGGCSLPGYYMYHGGSNPVGKGIFLNEHVAPRISYDFQAPIGESGQIRESYHRLKRLHMFYRDFAEELAPTEPALPEGAEAIDPRDAKTLRCATRIRGGSGFLFLNNYQDHAAMEDHPDVAVEVSSADGALRIPREGGFTLKSGTCAVMPFGMRIAGTTLEYATAQPLARLVVDGTQHLFFFAHDGIPAEYCLLEEGVSSVDGRLLLRPEPGLESALALRTSEGRAVIHTLSGSQSLGAYRMGLWGMERLLVGDAALFADRGDLCLRRRSDEPDAAEVLVFPPAAAPLEAAGAELDCGMQGAFQRLSTAFPARAVTPRVVRSTAGDAEVFLPAGAFEGAAELLLLVDYDGDVGNALLDGRLVADDFCNGAVWEIGLDRLRPRVETEGLRIHVTPRREGTAVVREAAMERRVEPDGKEVAAIRSVTAVAVREARIGPFDHGARKGYLTGA